jgi:benzaldehyde dehydrogenase (NAD)
LAVASLALRYKDEIVEWLMREGGSVRAKAEFEVALTVKAIRLAAAMPNQVQGIVLPSVEPRLSYARRRPVGVVGIIAPFNFPLYLAVRALAPAIAAGNAVVLKPDQRAAVSGGYVIARLFELAGLPSAILHVLPGGSDAGSALCIDPNIQMIQFTGSTGAGRSVGEAASKHLKKVSLELGGKNSLIICGDADLDLAVINAAWAAYLHQGQICMSAGRILVQREILEPFIERLVQKAESLPVGDPMTDTVAIGPLINTHQADHVVDVIAQSVNEGALLRCGGTVNGQFLSPAVLTNVGRDTSAFKEEIFGPVAVVVPFDTDEEAVSLANDSSYGLSAGVISKDIGRALALGNRLHCGLLHINDQTVNDDAVNPFSGIGSSGNGGSIGGVSNWELFTEWQWVTIQSEPPRYPI